MFNVKQYLKIILIFSVFASGYAQISEKRQNASAKYENAFAEKIDSTRILKNEAKLVYSSNDLFRSMHLESKSKTIFLIDIKEFEDYSGYIQYLGDEESFVLFECRGKGSGNPVYYMKIDKISGNREFLERRPKL